MPWRHSCFSQSWSGNVCLSCTPTRPFSQATGLIFSTPTDTHWEELKPPAISLLREIGSTSSLFSSVQSLSRDRLFMTTWTAAHQASLSITNSQSLLKLMSVESVMPSNHLILCHPFLLLPSIFPSIRAFSHESALQISWPRYWSFSFSISPSSEYSGLITFRMDWLDLLAIQGISLPSKGLSAIQESSTTPQFKSINSSAFSFLYSPTLTSIHDYWKNHSFD